jgi:DNA-binding NarL/FixJ family response regulator
MSPGPIRVVVVDDLGLVRGGLELLLGTEQGVQVVGAAATIDEAIEVVAAEAPDVVLLDLVMEGRLTLAAIGRLHAVASTAAIVVLAATADPHHAREAFAAGAAGFLLKDASPERLLEAVRDVADGTPHLDPHVGGRLAVLTQEEPNTSLELVVAREREVLQLLALGHTTNEIAAMVGRSPRTVELYRARIMTRLGLSNRAELVRYAIAHGFLDTTAGAAVPDRAS